MSGIAEAAARWNAEFCNQLLFVFIVQDPFFELSGMVQSGGGNLLVTLSIIRYNSEMSAEDSDQGKLRRWENEG